MTTTTNGPTTPIIPKFYADERVAVFIDGSNISAARSRIREKCSNNEGFDYSKLRDFFEDNTNLRSLRYYTATQPINMERPDPLRRLFDWLTYNGYNVVRKDTKTVTDAEGRERTKGNMDIEIAIDMYRMAREKQVDHVVLFSGDGDFRYVLEEMQKLGVRTTVFSTIDITADEIRRQADRFYELADVEIFHSFRHEADAVDMDEGEV